MKKVLMAAGALALGASAATAGGIERSSQSVGVLFEKNEYLELNFGGFSPDVSGATTVGSVPSGDMAPAYMTYSIAYKKPLTERLDFALILDQPVGAKVSYSDAAAAYPLRNASAAIDSTAVTALLRYKMPENFSLIGGLRVMTSKGTVNLPGVAAYKMTSTNETDLGYVLGVAWEKPEIAARVALTYNSKIKHGFTYTESALFPGVTGTSYQDVTIPESVNLEFQTGIAKDTLLFGSVRWVHWTQFDITPAGYALIPGGGGTLVDYKENVTTYNLGIGRKFNSQWSGAVSLGYERHTGTPTGNLGPTDGYKSIGLAASYQASDKVKITGGLRYVDIGDATTSFATFSGNKGWGAGVRVGITF